MTQISLELEYEVKLRADKTKRQYIDIITIGYILHNTNYICIIRRRISELTETT